MRERLLNVHIFAGFAGCHREPYVLVIRRADEYHIDVLTM
jgi:hypothetical protein